MSDHDTNENYVDLISSISYANDVFRITLARKQGDDDTVPVIRLLVPENQLLTMVNTLNDAAREIGEKVRGQMDGVQTDDGDGQTDNTVGEPAIAPPPDDTVPPPPDDASSTSSKGSESKSSDKFSLWDMKTWSRFNKS